MGPVATNAVGLPSSLAIGAPPTAAMLPQLPNTSSPPPSLLARLLPVPNGMQGLLTDEDVRNARAQGLLGFGSALLDASGPVMGPRPSLGAGIGRGIQAGQGAFQTAMQTAAQQNQQALAVQRQLQLEQARQGIEQKYANVPNGPEKLKAMFNDYVQAGDMEMVGKLAQVMPSLEKAPAAPKSLIRNDLGDRVELIDPTTGAVVKTEMKGATPRSADGIYEANLKQKADQSNKIIDDFARDTKKFDDVMAGWEVAEGALKDPSLATPFALLDAYARVSNPGGVVRPTTMEMLERMGSAGQKLRKYWEKNVNGQLPPDVTRDVVRTIYNIVQAHTSTFKRIRQQAILRGKKAGVSDLDELLQDFNPVNPLAAPNAGAAAATGSASVRQFLK